MVWGRRVRGTGMMISAIVVLMMTSAGCSTTMLSGGADLPSNTQIVGGGFRIYWEAPAPGTVYLVEKTSGKILETESLDGGASYEFDMDLSDEGVVGAFERIIGDDAKKARLVLYFKPAPSESQMP